MGTSVSAPAPAPQSAVVAVGTPKGPRQAVTNSALPFYECALSAAPSCKPMRDKLPFLVLAQLTPGRFLPFVFFACFETGLGSLELAFLLLSLPRAG